MSSTATSSPRYKRPLRKRILGHRLVRLLLTGLVSLLARIIFFSSRTQITIHPDAACYMNGTTQAIFCFWHGRMLFMPFLKPPKRKVSALISQHGDGAVIADILGWFGVQTVRGSTSRGARTALRGLLEIAARNENIAITPDGPRGPHQVAASGAIWLAAQTGLPIIPVSGSSTRRRHTKSWDAFTIPLPFGNICCIAGAPLHVPASNDDNIIEQYRLQLEQTLCALTIQMDAMVTTTTSVITEGA
jgi:lysophospholipid acyltransferase (LPLAT)-like uncharacterized protein